MAREFFVDPDECTGCELCVDMLPAVFRMNEQGISIVYAPDGAGEPAIQEVIDSCPALCIHWKE